MCDRSWTISALEEAGARLRIPLGRFRLLRMGHCAAIALKAAGLWRASARWVLTASASMPRCDSRGT